MFTGIIETTGEVIQVEPKGGDVRLHIHAPEIMDDVQLGDSIATNGVCLTVVDMPEAEGKRQGYIADVSTETLQLTTLGTWQSGQRVNLEKALLPQSRLGGHMVSGHVDGVGEVVARHSDARCERFRLRVPQGLAKYIAHKGSVTVDGTSLTVNAVDGCEFELAIVPHTLEKTVIGAYQAGANVNIEVDVIARYLERLLQPIHSEK